MNITILGTGMVGRTLASALAAKDHTVIIGTRNPEQTLARTDADSMGNPPFANWHANHSSISLKAFPDSVQNADIVFSALSGMGALDGLSAVGSDNLAAKILIDISNPLDFSRGFPPFLSLANTDSLGEQVQKLLPETKVVKALNTVTAPLMVNPDALANGDHNVCVSGNDEGAKVIVSDFLKSEFGWKDVIDLGDITTARGTEAALLWWTRLYSTIGNPMFAFKIVR